MDIIMIGIVIFVAMMILIGLLMYFILKEGNNVRISKMILYSFKHECEDDLDELITFSKSNNTKYKI